MTSVTNSSIVNVKQFIKLLEKIILSFDKTVCNVILTLVVIVLEDYILVKMGWHCALG